MNQLFGVAQMNRGLQRSILSEKYGSELAKSLFISEIHDAQSDAAKITAVIGATLFTGGLALETAPLWIPAAGKFFSVESSLTRFVADGIVQGGISYAKGESMVDNYNIVSGVSNLFLVNPFAAAGVGGTFNLSRNETSFDLSRGTVSGVLGGSLGTAFQKASSSFSKSIPGIS